MVANFTYIHNDSHFNVYLFQISPNVIWYVVISFRGMKSKSQNNIKRAAITVQIVNAHNFNLEALEIFIILIGL